MAHARHDEQAQVVGSRIVAVVRHEAIDRVDPVDRCVR